MASRFRSVSRAILGAALLCAPLAASAVPFTFRFDMPAFTSGVLAGLTSVLDVTVDNGGASSLSQSFLNTEITNYAVSIDTTALSASGAITNTQDSVTYITTNGAGVPVLDLSAAIDSFAISSVGGNAIQLGTRDGGGPTQYSVTINGQTGNNSNNLIVTGALLQQSLPGPATLPLLAAGLALVGFAFRRRGARASGHHRGPRASQALATV